MEPKHLKYLIILALFKECLANLRIKKVVCNYVDKDFFKLDLCEVKPNKQGIPGVSINLRLLQVPITNCIVNSELYHLSQKNAMLLVNYTWNACEALRTLKKNTLFHTIYKKVAMYSNVNHTCPYNHDVYVKDYAPAKMSIPVPNGNYKAKVSLTISGKRRIAGDIYVENA